MGELTRTRLVAAGVAALGVALGFGVGAATGTVVSPDTTLPAPPTSTTSTTLPRALPAYPTGAPIDAPAAPPVAAIGMQDGALVVLGDIPDDRLLLLEAGGRATERRLSTPGSIVAVGDVAIALGSSSGVMVVPLDGSEPVKVETAQPITWHGDGLIAWLAPSPGGTTSGQVMAVDLDAPEPDVFALATFPLDFDRVRLVAADRDGVVLTVTDPAVASTFVVGPEVAPAAPLPPGETFAALLPQTIATISEDGTLRHRDRSTLDVVEGPEGPLDPTTGEPCAPTAGAGPAVLWQCPSGDLVATSGELSVSFPAMRAELVGRGRFVVWFIDEESLDDASLVRVTDLETGSTGSLRSPGLPILQVRP